MNFAQITSYMTDYWHQIWRLTQITIPIFNITIAEFLLGCLIINIAVIIFRSYFLDYFSASPFKSHDSAKYVPKNSHEQGQSRTGGSL